MLIAENKTAFDNPDFLYELKLDGIRCFAYVDADSVELRNKRNKRLNEVYPELSDIHRQVKTRCILDGELVAIRDGKPNFYEVQRRSLMTNPVKIDLQSRKLPVSFTAFDIVYFDNSPITDLPLVERKNMLSDVVNENSRIAVSRYIEESGIELFNLTKQQSLEGIVAKRKDSKYYFGKRTKDWIKIKALQDDDFIICGYYSDNLILGSRENNAFVYKSHVSFGISRSIFHEILKLQRVNKSEYYRDFPDFDEAVWVEPKLVCTVQYMERTAHGGLRQPVFKGLRDDVL